MDEKELFEKVCSPRLANIEITLKDNHAEVMKLLRGYNNNPGLVQDVNNIKKFNRIIIGAVLFIISTLFVQLVVYIKDVLTQ